MFQSGRNHDGQGRRSSFRPLGVPFALLLALAGCRSNNKSALVEAELRTREREVRALRNDLERSEMLSGALQNELFGRPGCSVPIPGGVDSPQAMLGGMVKNVTLGRGTGGVDDDGTPGDEALAIVIVPQDTDGSAIKVPGQAVIQAYEMTAAGLKVPLSRWEVPAAELQRTWKSGLLTSGYTITLPWKTLPSTEKVRVVVQFFTLPNHRPFEVDKDIAIKLPPGLPRRAPSFEALPSPKPGGLLQEGPVLTPGAWFRERDSSTLKAAKPAPPEPPVRLLGPRLKPDDEGR